ncbi:MAG: TolC family protein [Rickettsiales bacterium]|jgi:outer membrane protein TolC|nr:TolC family protein [Rickettsiales bacterium]
MKKILIAISALGFATGGSPARADECPQLGDENTLSEIIEIGLCRNPTTKMSYLSAEISRMQKNQQYAKYLPSASGNFNAAATDSDDYNTWNKSAGITASYLIFDFGKRYFDLSRMASIWKATGFSYDNAVQNYVYGVIGAYYGLLTADAELKANGDIHNVAKEAQTTAAKKYKAGAVARADVLRADTTLAQRKTDLERSKGAREIASARLLSMLSMPPDTAIKIKDMPSEFGASSEIEDARELIELAEKQRPDVRAAASETDAAMWARNAAFTAHLPTISASGGIDFSPDADWAQTGTNVRVGVSVPIFAGFANLYGDRIAMASYERAKESERRTIDDARLDVWTAFQNYKTAIEVLASTDALLKSATESERIVAGMYKVGRSTMLDWQSSQADLASAQRQSAAAKYDLFVKRAALAMSVGELRD